MIILPSVGEELKSFDVLQSILTRLLAMKIDRRTTLIALGGGVIGDLTGFAASIALRGLPFVQVPTTLLSQVDSSVGGKTAINTEFGKNLIGSFYQPKAVLIDLDVLKTLPPRHVKSGLAEVIKYGLINSPEFFDYLEAHAPQILAFDMNVLGKAVRTSCQLKADIVAKDETEAGMRALLNLGHTFGHAIELEAAYDGTVTHGEAVSAGMMMAFEFSYMIGECAEDDVSRVRNLLKALDMPYRVKDLLKSPNPAKLLEHMGHDKKVIDDRMRLILARGIGQSYIAEDVNKLDLHNYLVKACG